MIRERSGRKRAREGVKVIRKGKAWKTGKDKRRKVRRTDDERVRGKGRWRTNTGRGGWRGSDGEKGAGFIFFDCAATCSREEGGLRVMRCSRRGSR